MPHFFSRLRRDVRLRRTNGASGTYGRLGGLTAADYDWRGTSNTWSRLRVQRAHLLALALAVHGNWGISWRHGVKDRACVKWREHESSFVNIGSTTQRRIIT